MFFFLKHVRIRLTIRCPQSYLDLRASSTVVLLGSQSTRPEYFVEGLILRDIHLDASTAQLPTKNKRQSLET